jgi:hypothetical protein
MAVRITLASTFALVTLAAACSSDNDAGVQVVGEFTDWQNAALSMTKRERRKS